LSTKRRFVQKTAIDGVVLEEMLVTVAARFDERGWWRRRPRRSPEHLAH